VLKRLAWWVAHLFETRMCYPDRTTGRHSTKERKNSGKAGWQRNSTIRTCKLGSCMQSP